MRSIFIADDGTEFDDEDDCLEYEASAVLKNDSIMLFDEECNRITNVRDLDNVYYGYFKTPEDATTAKELIYEWVGTCSVQSIDDAGYWAYSFKEDEFVNIDFEIERLENCVKNIKDIKDKLFNRHSQENFKAIPFCGPFSGPKE